jgi:hypothetical protein
MIRRDLIKMPKALRAEINDVVVKYAERKLRKDGSLDDGTRNDPEPR